MRVTLHVTCVSHTGQSQKHARHQTMHVHACKVGLGDSTIVIHCRDSRSNIVMMIVLITIVIVVDMIFK